MCQDQYVLLLYIDELINTPQLIITINKMTIQSVICWSVFPLDLENVYSYGTRHNISYIYEPRCIFFILNYTNYTL